MYTGLYHNVISFLASAITAGDWPSTFLQMMETLSAVQGSGGTECFSIQTYKGPCILHLCGLLWAKLLQQQFEKRVHEIKSEDGQLNHFFCLGGGL